MKGKILGFDEGTGEGVISGDDGKRYSFKRGEWKSDRPVVAGRDVDFAASGDVATQIYVQSASNSGEKNKLVAALLAFFLGSFGFHKFYLGKKKAGIIMLAVFLLGVIAFAIPSLIISLIAFIEAIIYLTKSDDEFERTYVLGNKSWF